MLQDNQSPRELLRNGRRFGLLNKNCCTIGEQEISGTLLKGNYDEFSLIRNKDHPVMACYLQADVLY
ncbi:hypothetical protein JNUCC31_31645 [Paenibacillus sp. JNUCC31]|uniref:hypothetical protein n=1 Tax=Paenibacillus sp. JNUCC-31 TaxID=2777983 RepID=UPI0017826C75|nr:hypothetical protein [Paenibacillus sp. JNUCC-31]QOS79158.1 hypothetical protein JNUCC31_31645 [Paenibacillus sp. JNUCC-31]